MVARTPSAQPRPRLSRREHPRRRPGLPSPDTQSQGGFDRVAAGRRIPAERHGDCPTSDTSASRIGGRDDSGDCMSGVLVRQVGILDLLDLNVISEFYGRDFLPYPFMFTQPSRFATRDEALAYASAVPDRFNHGDLGVFMQCVAAYDAADIRVECHIQYIPADTPSVRAMAYRTGQLGFFTQQRPDTDLIDIYTVSPYDLGAAICEAA